MTFAWLLIAHYFGDYALQSSWVADHKGKFWYVMFAHCMIWTGCICVALQFLGILTVWKFFVLLAGHYLMDTIKWNYFRTDGEEETRVPALSRRWTYADQGFHFLQLVAVFFIGVV